ncbi:MAG: cytochrome c3 family protein [Proteobacteria bacterium]|nr:cytochrome c3 family protein [Pseudomonadota bacterium]MBU1714481.1 cytochrome c3 family protein [Pseudomonadota bacterium]
MLNIKRLLPVTIISLLTCLGIFTVAGDLFAGPYLTSGHGGSNNAAGGQGVRRLTGYSDGNCAHCHEQHASINGNEPAPDNNKASERLLFSDLKLSGYANNDFCLYCHGGPNPPNGEDNIKAQFDKAPLTQHDPGTTASLNLANGPVTCLKCHNPHAAQSSSILGTHQEATDGNSVANSGPLQGVSGAKVNLWPAPAPPTGGTESIDLYPSLSDVDPITMEYELCFKCHSFMTEPGMIDIGAQFNPGNYSVHPVTTTGPWINDFLRNNQTIAFVGNWANITNLNAKMYCSDCHNSDGSGSPALGPHGSIYPRLAKAGPPDFLCLSCHNVLAASNFTDPDISGLNGDHSLPQHLPISMGGTAPEGCLTCHGGPNNPALISNIHGANYLYDDVPGVGLGRPSKEFLVSQYITQNYYADPGPGDVKGNRWCAATCHTGSVAYNY